MAVTAEVVRFPVPKPASGKVRDTKADGGRVAFTELRLEKMPRPAKGEPARYEYDAAEAGLAVRLTPGASTFVFYRWHAGKPGRITIGKVGEVPLRDARAIAAGYRGDLARGIDVFARDRERKAERDRPVTLADAFDAHVARPDMRRSTRRDYDSLWKLVPARLRKRAIAEVGQTELVALHAEVGKRHPRTANKLVSLLSALLRGNGRKADNPVAEVRRFREEPRQRVLSVSELHALRTALDDEAEPWRSFFLLAMLTGARRGALARMRWDNIDLDGAVWRVPAEWSKNRKTLAVALPSEAVSVLIALHKRVGASEWAFPARSKAGHVTEPMKAWNRIIKRAGIEGAKPHDLRRTLGTAIAADGGGAMVSAVLGHMSSQSAKSYIHLSSEMARGAVERAAARTRRATDGV